VVSTPVAGVEIAADRLDPPSAIWRAVRRAVPLNAI